MGKLYTFLKCHLVLFRLVFWWKEHDVQYIRRVAYLLRTPTLANSSSPTGKDTVVSHRESACPISIPRTLDVIGAYIDDIRKEKMTTINTNMYVLCFSNVM
jgi:hypothetical protein